MEITSRTIETDNTLAPPSESPARMTQNVFMRLKNIYAKFSGDIAECRYE